MPFDSPHQPLHLPPLQDAILPHFLLNPAEQALNADRASQPLLFPPSQDSQVSSRPQAKPLTLADTKALAYRIAHGLLNGRLDPEGKPFKKGDVIAFYAPNQHDYVPILLGIQLAGGVAALCNPSYKPQELAHQLRMTEARAILTSANVAQQQHSTDQTETPLTRAQEAAKLAHTQDENDLGLNALQYEPTILVFDEEHERSVHKLIAANQGQSLTDEQQSTIQEQSKTISGDDAAVYCFSSGTSGLPKAVILTHSNLVCNTIQATFLLYDRMNKAIDEGKRYSKDEKNGWYDNAERKGAGRELLLSSSEPASSKKSGSGSGSGAKGSGLQKSIARLSQQIKNGFGVKSTKKSSDTTVKQDTKQEQEEQLPPSGYLSVANDEQGQTGFSRIESRPPGEREFHIDVLPQFHCYGLLVNLVAFHTVTPRIILPRFHLETYLSSVQQHGVTFSFVVPPILLALAKHPLVEQYDISTLWRVASGAASLPDEIALAVRKRLGILCTDGYGMSEMSPIVAMQTLRDIQRAPNTVGVLAPNTQALVLKSEGEDAGEAKPCRVDESGELLLRGPQMMKGYLRNEEANEKAFYTDKDGEKWLKTGDVVRISKNGHITITDRLKDVIKAKGFQVSPAELEAVLFKDARVQDAAVIGTLDAKDNAERPWAFVVASSDVFSTGKAKGENEEEQKQQERDTIAKSILDKVNAQVAGYKKIAGLTWLDALPKNEAGKVLKKNLKAEQSQS